MLSLRCSLHIQVEVLIGSWIDEDGIQERSTKYSTFLFYFFVSQNLLVLGGEGCFISTSMYPSSTIIYIPNAEHKTDNDSQTPLIHQ